MSIYIKDSGDPTPEEIARQRYMEHAIRQASAYLGDQCGAHPADVMAACMSRPNTTNGPLKRRTWWCSA